MGSPSDHPPVGRPHYAAFLSYSHAADNRLAPALQRGLQLFAKPWYRKRALEVFRDATGLAVTPALWPEIEKALSASEHFVLLCSPEAAASPWVQREVTWWLEHRGLASLHLVLAAGRIEWDSLYGCIDSHHTNALPVQLLGRYGQVPMYADCRWARADSDLELPQAEFRAVVRQIAAALLGKTPEEVYSEEAAALRRNLMWAVAAAVLLLASTVVAISATLRAQRETRVAEARERTSRSRALAAEALDVLKTDLSLATLLAVEAVQADPTVEARGALLTSLLAHPFVDTNAHVFEEPFGAEITEVAFINGGSSLLVATADGALLRWRVQERAFDPELLRHAGGGEWLTDLAISGDGSLAAILLATGTVEAWRLPGCEPVAGFERGSQGAQVQTRALSLSSDGSQTALGLSSGRLELWDRDSGQRIGEAFGALIPEDERAHRVGVQVVKFAPDDRALVSGHGGNVMTSDGASYRIWDLTPAVTLRRTIPMPGDAARALCFGKQQKRLYLGGAGGLLIAWDLDLDERVEGFGGAPKSHVTSLLAGGLLGSGPPPAGEVLLAIFLDGQMAAWAMEDGSLIGRPWSPGAVRLEAMSSSPKDGSLAVAGSDGSVVLGRVGRPPLRRQLDTAGPMLAPTYLAVSGDGARIAAMSHRFVWVWDRAQGTVLAKHELESGSQTIALGFVGEQLIRLTQSGEVWQPKRGSWETIGDVPADEAASELLGRGGQKQQRPWAQALRRSSDQKAGQGTLSAISLNGSVMVRKSGPMSVEIARGTTVQPVPLYPEDGSAWIGGLAVTRGGDLAAIGLGDGRMVLVQCSTGKIIGKPLDAHRGGVVALDFLYDGTLLASGSRDGTVVLWDVGTRQPIGIPLPRHSKLSQIFALTFTEDGRELVVSHSDGRVDLIDVAVDSWIERGLTRANRPMTALEWQQVMGDIPMPVDRWEAKSPPIR